MSKCRLPVLVDADESGAADAVEQLFIEKDLIGGGHERLNRVRMRLGDLIKLLIFFKSLDKQYFFLEFYKPSSPCEHN